MILRIFISLSTLTLFVASCNMTFEVGLEQIPTRFPSATLVAPTQVMTPTPIASEIAPTETAISSATSTSSPTPTKEIPTYTPSPTPLPGKEVIPISSMATDIPWLPLDRTRWPSSQIVTFNTLLPPFDNPLVRYAFAASIDKNMILDMAKRYYAVDPSPATTFIHPQTLGRNLYGTVGINFDPVKARDLLAQAGYEDTSSFPTVTFIVSSYGETAPGARFNMANAMADMWRTHLGVTVKVEAYPFYTHEERIKTNPPALFGIGWLPGDGNDPDRIIRIFHSGSEFNYGHFSDPAFDALVDRAAGLHDPTMRQALYIEAERELCEVGVGIIPLYYTFANLP